MRLRIEMKGNDFSVPIAYRHLLQGLIYNMLNRDTTGDFYHNEGFKVERKNYKLFVFSDIYGKYRFEKRRLYFDDTFYFFISSVDEAFINEIYDFLNQNQILVIDRQIVTVTNVKIINTPHIKNSQAIWLKTLSPITVYKKVDDKIIYYKPDDLQFSELIIKNLKDKILAYDYPVGDITFEINDYRNVREKMIEYKDCRYLAFQLQMKCKVSSDVFAFLYNSGVSAKGSCGFGMIDLVYEKNTLSI